VLGPGSRRAALRLCAVGLIGAVAACGTPSHLDAQEKVAFARECTSLIERNLSGKQPPRVGSLAGEKLDLDDPAAFYDAMHRLRGPQTYDLHDPAHSADTARQPLDNCSLNPLSSLFPSRSTTTTTPTTTTTTATTTPGS
jgi:hypothetical protein